MPRPLLPALTSLLALLTLAPGAHAIRAYAPPPRPVLEVAAPAPVADDAPRDHLALQLGLNPTSARFTGLAQLGLTGTTADSFQGVFQLSLFHNRATRFAGVVQPGPIWNDASEFRGVAQAGVVNTSDDFVGLTQVGGYNQARRFRGLMQVGVVTVAEEFTGLVQLGMFQYAGDFRGLLQVGLGGFSFAKSVTALAQVGSAVTFAENFQGVMMVSGANFVRHEFTGLMQLAIGVNHADDALYGAQVALIHNRAGHVHGLQLGLVNLAARSGGGDSLDASDLDGVQLGGFNWAGDASGLQVGLVNASDRTSGVQVGLVNVTDHLRGVQLGLVNVSHDGGLPVAPLMNVGW